MIHNTLLFLITAIKGNKLFIKITESEHTAMIMKHVSGFQSVSKTSQMPSQDANLRNAKKTTYVFYI